MLHPNNPLLVVVSGLSEVGVWNCFCLLCTLSVLFCPGAFAAPLLFAASPFQDIIDVLRIKPPSQENEARNGDACSNL